jgi:hypothetical protein
MIHLRPCRRLGFPSRKERPGLGKYCGRHCDVTEFNREPYALQMEGRVRRTPLQNQARTRRSRQSRRRMSYMTASENQEARMPGRVPPRRSLEPTGGAATRNAKKPRSWRHFLWPRSARRLRLISREPIEVDPSRLVRDLLFDSLQLRRRQAILGLSCFEEVSNGGVHSWHGLTDRVRLGFLVVRTLLPGGGSMRPAEHIVVIMPVSPVRT